MTGPCGGVVAFNYAEWVVQYPEFSYVSAGQAQSFFNRVTIGGPVDNTPSSPFQDLFERTILLNLATAHMAFLFAPSSSPGQPRQLVGRINNATEGSVSVQTEYMVPSGDALEAWWNQSPYGAEYYASTQRFRAAFYVPPARAGAFGGPFAPGLFFGRFR